MVNEAFRKKLDGYVIWCFTPRQLHLYLVSISTSWVG